MGILTQQHDEDGHCDDLQIEPQRPIALLLLIIFNTRLYFLDRVGPAAVPVKLRPAGDAGSDVRRTV